MDKILNKCLDALNIKLENKYINLLLNYWNFLLKYNKYINLISRNQNLENSFISHIVDSLTPLMFQLPLKSNYLDIGSGGGLPAIPLTIVRPFWRTTLVEAKKKKSEYLRQAGLFCNFSNFAVINEHIDSHSKFFPEPFNFITTRGFASLSDTIPLICSFLAKDGIFLAFKGPLGQKELDDASNILEKRGLECFSRNDFILPIINSKRSLLYFRKKS
jgi:16S rRNA (guanine527-N7)-methyltransferase